jgi:hypothetical protein
LCKVKSENAPNMSLNLDDLLSQLWTSRTLQRDALDAAHGLDPKLRMQLGNLASLLAERVALRAQTSPANRASGAQDEKTMSDERLGGLLELLTLAVFHSDTLLYLPHDEREERLGLWAERTGFDQDLVREATILGPAGINAFLRRAA